MLTGTTTVCAALCDQRKCHAFAIKKIVDKNCELLTYSRHPLLISDPDYDLYIASDGECIGWCPANLYSGMGSLYSYKLLRQDDFSLSFYSFIFLAIQLT